MNDQDTIKEQSVSKKIKVLGLGGSGCNTISRLSVLDLPGIELIAANTDAFSLTKCSADRTILLGKNTTSGHGTGGDPQTGRNAAEESHNEIIDNIKGADLLFLTAGLGGGTGSGAIEIAARIANSLNILTISIVTLPFSFEADRRRNTALSATISLQPYTNTLITIPNDRLLRIAASDTPFQTALAMSDDILIKGLQGISEILNNQGLLNIDFSHISKLMQLNGGTHISIGYGSGVNRVANALTESLAHPLLESTPIHQAQGIIIKLTGNIKINEIDYAISFLKEQTPEGVEIIPAIEQKELGDDRLMVSLILTGMGATPIHYPEKAKKEIIHTLQTENRISSKTKGLVHEKMVDNFDDDIEVPAFLRKGYNLINQK